MTFRSDIDALILATLSEGPLHGYAIVRQLRNRGEGVFKLGEGQMYPILHRLESDGLIAAHWDEQRGKPSRRVYSLTGHGKEELKRRRSAWELYAKSINAVFKLG